MICPCNEKLDRAMGLATPIEEVVDAVVKVLLEVAAVADVVEGVLVVEELVINPQ